MKNVLRKFWADDRGTETVEWAIIIGLIATGAVTLAVLIGGHVTDAFTNLETALQEIPAAGGAG